jgi:hypothetical protein
MQAATTAILALAAFLGQPGLTAAADAPSPADQWRTEHRLIDLHQHINLTTQHVTRAVKIMDAAGLGVAVNLGAGTVIRGANGTPSDFERGKALTDALFPGRILHYMTLDYRGWDAPDFGEQAARQVEEGHRLGSAGLKEFKRLGVGLRDGAGKLIRVDDPKLDPVWRKCGELGLPVSIHVADPKAFWQPFDERNERWAELKDHKGWWIDYSFGTIRVAAMNHHTSLVVKNTGQTRPETPPVACDQGKLD